IELEIQNEELKRYQSQLQTSKNRYFEMYNFAPIGYFTLDQKELIKDVNIAGANLLGLGKNKLINSAFIRFIAPQSRNRFFENVKNFRENKEHLKCELELLRDKKTFPVIMEISSRPTSEGRLESLLITIIDITELKEAEEDLKNSEERFRTVADFCYDWEYWVGPDGKLIYVSPSCERITGYKRDEFIEDPSLLEKIVHPDDIELIVEHLGEASENEDSEVRTYRIITKQGEEKWIGHGCEPVYSDKGKFLGRRVSNRDINHRIKVENDLRESEEFLDNIVGNIPNMIFVKNAEDLSFKRVNKVGEIYFGHSSDELIGKSDYDFFPKDEADFFTQKDREVLQSKKLLDIPEETIQTKKLGPRLLHTKKIPLLDKEGNPEYLLGISEDITELKKAENKIKESLKEKENLLKEIHHRVKNNLQIISSLLDLQEEYVKDDPTAVNVLMESQNRVLSMAMIHEMLYQSEDLNSINFSAYLRNLVSNLCDSYGIKNLQSIIDVDETYLNMETSVPLGLIISELVSNSLKHAFPDKKLGELTISLQREDDQFKLIIKDNGIGFPEDLDFKNIKSTLGLKLVHSLINQIDGTIELDRTHGTKYTINFQELQYKERL
ncbi:MAG: PAS domain S-box protein, partial [Methanobacterium sp.]|nr:PAS domain S-box protein [Methanobacterium sp.]